MKNKKEQLSPEELTAAQQEHEQDNGSRSSISDDGDKPRRSNTDKPLRADNVKMPRSRERHKGKAKRYHLYSQGSEKDETPDDDKSFKSSESKKLKFSDNESSGEFKEERKRKKKKKGKRHLREFAARGKMGFVPFGTDSDEEVGAGAPSPTRKVEKNRNKKTLRGESVEQEEMNGNGAVEKVTQGGKEMVRELRGDKRSDEKVNENFNDGNGHHESVEDGDDFEHTIKQMLDKAKTQRPSSTEILLWFVLIEICFNCYAGTGGKTFRQRKKFTPKLCRNGK